MHGPDLNLLNRSKGVRVQSREFRVEVKRVVVGSGLECPVSAARVRAALWVCLCMWALQQKLARLCVCVCVREIVCVTQFSN